MATKRHGRQQHAPAVGHQLLDAAKIGIFNELGK